MTDRDIIHNLEEKIKHQRIEIKRLLDSGNILLAEKEKYRLENVELKKYVNKYLNLSNCAVDLLLCEDDRRELKIENDKLKKLRDFINSVLHSPEIPNHQLYQQLHNVITNTT